ncbi:MAG: DUF4491 family protein [Rikenellaceae bacterium]|jgi:hypothetical protein|nr:DUF4491 family protein [Rikenellaceae bacterium]
MDAFLSEYRLFGLALGLATFLIIGLFHPIVVKAEYYWGVKSWYCFLLFGFFFAALAVIIHSNFLSAIMGVTAFSSFWSILEVFHQKKRVEKGWFPENPKKRETK